MPRALVLEAQANTQFGAQGMRRLMASSKRVLSAVTYSTSSLVTKRECVAAMRMG